MDGNPEYPQNTAQRPTDSMSDQSIDSSADAYTTVNDSAAPQQTNMADTGSYMPSSNGMNNMPTNQWMPPQNTMMYNLNGGLSESARLGIGLGVALGIVVLMLLTVSTFTLGVMYRRRKARRQSIMSAGKRWSVRSEAEGKEIIRKMLTELAADMEPVELQVSEIEKCMVAPVARRDSRV